MSTHRKQVLSSNLPELGKSAESFHNCYGDSLKAVSYLEEENLSELFSLLRGKLKIVDHELYRKHETEILEIRDFDDWLAFYKKLCGKDGAGFYLKNGEGYQYLLHEVIMIYHRRNALRLMDKHSKERNIKYSGVVAYRPDLYFIVPLDLSKLVLSDHTFYYRLEFMIVSSVGGMKKLVEKLLENYYCNNQNSTYVQEYKRANEGGKAMLNLSETQHDIVFCDKECCLNRFEILDELVHFRALNDSKHTLMCDTGDNHRDLCLHHPSGTKHGTFYIDYRHIESDLPKAVESMYETIADCSSRVKHI